VSLGRFLGECLALLSCWSVITHSLTRTLNIA